MTHRNDSPISTFVELDPEPSPRAGSTQRREAFVGVALVLAVLLFVGWQWWRAESNRTNYEAGTQAAARKDWDEAQRRFAAAPGYKDADSLATSAAKQIAERDSLYSAAHRHSAHANPVAALSDLQKLSAIQPGYSDVAQLEQQAQTQTYAEALPAAIALRPSAQPPGLYYRAKSGWLWLEGSDANTRLRWPSEESRVVYDVPRPDAPSQPTSTPKRSGSATYTDTDLTTRNVVIATLNPEATSTAIVAAAMPFKPQTNNTFYQPGRNGVWEFRYKSQWTLPDIPVRQGAIGVEGLAYWEYGSPTITTVDPPDPAKNSVLVSVDPNSNRLLFADWYDDAFRGPVVRLYVMDADGANKRMLYSRASGFEYAYFTPDGQSVLLTTYLVNDHSARDAALILLESHGASPPITLVNQESVSVPQGSSGDFSFPIRSKIVEKGPFAGQVLVVERLEGHNLVKLFDLAHPAAPTAAIDVPSQEQLDWYSVTADTPGLVLVSWPFSSYGGASPDSSGNATIFVNIPLNAPPTLAELPLPGGSGSGSVRPFGERLIYTVATFNKPYNKQTMEFMVYSMPLADLGKKGVVPTQLFFKQYETTDPYFEDPGSKFLAGPRVVAYIEGNNLHVYEYDTKADVVLEKGVTLLALRSLPDEYKQLR